MSKMVLVAAILLLGAGCSRLPDFGRLQNTMDRMAYNTSIMAANMPCMAQNTGRMANTAERMQAKVDGMLDNLGEDRKSAETAVQNYSQAFIDGDRAMIKALKRIRKELSELSRTVGERDGKAAPAREPRTEKELQARLERIEARLKALSSKLEGIEKKKTP